MYEQNAVDLEGELDKGLVHCPSPLNPLVEAGKDHPMKLSDALKASRTLCQAINRSGKYALMVVENDDFLFGTGKDTRWYSLSIMRDLTTRRYFEPIYASHLGLADIEGFLSQGDYHPPIHDTNPQAWEPVQ